MRVLGIDPGSGVTGWGVIEASARGVSYLASGTIDTRRCGSFADRLHRICDRVQALVREWAPHAVGLERAFVARNVQAAFRLGEARGAVLVGAAAEGVHVHEYAPAAVKLAVAGSGRADKEQVGRGIARLLRIDESLPRDASDALAVALCHLYTSRVAQRVQRAVEGSRRGAKGRAPKPPAPVFPRKRSRRGWSGRGIRGIGGIGSPGS